MICAILLCLSVVVLLFVIFNKHLPVWFCEKLNWHIADNNISFDGHNFVSTCVRCGKKIANDNWKNWF